MTDYKALADAQAAEIAEAKGQIEFLDRQNTGLRDQHSRDSKTLREYAQARDDLRKERDRLRQQLEWTERYALDSLKTNSRDMDDWRGDMRHIANSARAALAQEQS